MSATSTKPHVTGANYSRVELASAIDFTAASAKLNNGREGLRPRSVYCTSTGGGTLVATTDAGHELVMHGLEAGKYAEPSPLVLRATKVASDEADVSAFILVDDSTQTSTFTGWADDTADANDADTADVLFMPASEAAGDGFLVGSTQPFNGLALTLSTAGVGSTMTWQVYTGDPTTYDATYTDLAEVTGAAKNLTASGDVSWLVPDDWVPCNINSYGNLYWVLGKIVGTYSTNPVGTQVRIKNQTTVGGIRIAP